MSANDLLIWMSARREGSWQQFRTAVEQLHLASEGSDSDGGREEDTADQHELPLYQELRLNLQRLGHAEFFAGAGESDWRVTPPSLAVMRSITGTGSWLGVVTGARSLKLLQRLRDAARPGCLDTLPAAAAPDQLRIVAEEYRPLSEVARQVGLRVQDDAPATILMSLPPIDDPAVRRHISLPFGDDWRIDRWSPSHLSWKTSTRNEALSTSLGLFRFLMGHQHHMLLCSRGSAFQVPTQVGKYVVLKHRRRRRGIVRYDSATHRLSVFASCRPPFLVERALILCSGALPEYEPGYAATGTVHYTGIPRGIAALASALLRQEHR